MSDDAKRKTWESIKRRPEVAALVRSDPVFARFVADLVATFGPLESVEVTETVKPNLENYDHVHNVYRSKQKI